MEVLTTHIPVPKMIRQVGEIQATASVQSVRSDARTLDNQNSASNAKKQNCAGT